MKTRIKIEASDPSFTPEDKSGAQVQEQTQTRRGIEPVQESTPVDLEKFERLCCLGDEHACQRLGGKHHRTNARCWTYPKVCYHCDLNASVDSKAKFLYMTSFQTQLGTLDASVASVTSRSISRKASSVNKKSFRTNRKIRQWGGHKVKAMVNPDASERPIPFCVVQENSDSFLVSDAYRSTTPELHSQSIPNTLVESIEEYVPPETGQDRCPEKDMFVCVRHRRSQAPSPEIQLDVSNDSDPCDGVEKEPLVDITMKLARRDPRNELGFLMNSFG